MNEPISNEQAAPFLKRLAIYFSERFPVVKHGVVIAAFGASAACLSAMMRGAEAGPSVHAVIVAIVVLFLLFFQLRVSDEHKDFDEDALFRPERAVPRGLISLVELRRLAYGAAVLQIVLTWTLHPPLMLLLIAVWGWMALMTVEFFVPIWLQARPIAYMVSHMAVMPLIDLYATATDWLPAGGKPTEFALPLGAFLALSFVNGAALEIGRKSWAPEMEREGVETYSKLWGARRAGWVLVAIIWIGFVLSVVVNLHSAAPLHYLTFLVIAAVYAAWTAASYALAPTPKTAGRIETAAGSFVALNYLALGVLPMGELLWLS
ncbi:MAG: UbiA family prenyltransferase [Pseudomonadota bacterium]